MVKSMEAGHKIYRLYTIMVPEGTIKNILLDQEKLKIAMTDIISNCKRSEDINANKCLIKKTYNRKAIKSILTNNDIEKIFFTSKWVGAEFRETFKEIDHIQEMINLPSPSAIFRRMSFKDKVN